MGRTQENLGHAEFFLADVFDIFAGEDGQIHGDKGEAFAVDIQHQAPRIDGIMERLFGHRGDADLRCAG
jgi:hypothetical protein